MAKRRNEAKEDFIAGFKAGAVVLAPISAVMLFILWILL